MATLSMNLLVAELRRDEGVKYVKYADSKGIPTTGVGHNLLVNPLPAGWMFPLSDAQVNQLLAHDLAVVFAALDLHFPWWRSLDDVRQRVMANMTFNMGIGTLSEFHNTLNAIQHGEYSIAASGMESSAWFKQVGQRAVRLCQAMKIGVMPDEPSI
jgi:lysozyme